MNTKLHQPIIVVLMIAMLVTSFATACAHNHLLTKSARFAAFEKSSAVIESKKGEQHEFTVYLALTPAQRKQGLSHITDLRDEEGMLFIFPRSQYIRMWMKNTPTSLDMFFINERGIILQIVNNTTPNSTESIRSDDNAYAVLEVKGGTAGRLGIDVGDRVVHDQLKLQWSANPKAQQ